MENTIQTDVFDFFNTQVEDTETEVGTGSGDAMLGWFTDEEFDQMADSIINHFEAITGNVDAEVDDDLAIGEILGWLVKESIKLMPDAALKYVRYLIDEQLREHASTPEMDKEFEEWIPSRSVLMSEVY